MAAVVGNADVSLSSRASMRRMKAAETLAVALKAPAAPKKIAEVDFSNATHVDTNATVKTGPGVYYNKFYGNSWLMHFVGISSIATNVSIEKDPSKAYTLDLNHLSSLVDGKPGAKITIKVNDKVVKAGYNPNNGNYISEKFDITKYVVNGNNTILLSLDMDGFSNYWINHLSVLES